MKRTTLKRRTALRPKKPMERKAKVRPTIQDMIKKGTVIKLSSFSGKPSEKTNALEAADNAFSKLVRLTAADDDGYLHCFICGTPIHWMDAVNMHCEPRLCMSVRFSTINAQAGCSGCNGKPNGDRDNFRIMLDARFGQGTAEKNEILSKTMEQMGSKYLRYLADKFNAAIDLIRKKSPHKFTEHRH